MADSIATAPPDDLGGRRARRGFRYQDLCALRYCIRSAADGTWTEVWCESHDDIVLYRREAGGEVYRFVQVKHRQSAGQHWSPAELCEASRQGGGSAAESILGKLFARDRFAGSSDFRLATNEGVSRDLQPLLYAWGHFEPQPGTECPGLHDILDRLRAWEPPENGRPLHDCVRRFAIERHAADTAGMVAELMWELDRFLRAKEQHLCGDELEKLLDVGEKRVAIAAEADLDQPGNPERIEIWVFASELTAAAGYISDQTTATARTRPDALVRNELQAIGADEAEIGQAIELRQRYYREWRRARGSERGKQLDQAYAGVLAICHTESMARCDGTDGAGRQLLGELLRAVRDYHRTESLAGRGIDFATVAGMVYFLVGRGALRLAR